MIENIKEKVIAKVSNTSWYPHLRMYLLGDEFTKVLEQLKEFKDENRRFTPSIGDVFNPFVRYNFDEIRGLFLFDKPYSTVGFSTGIPLDSSKIKKFTPNPAIAFSKDLGRKLNKDLSDFAEGKVMLLHASPTTDIIESNSLMHYKIWSPFISCVLDVLDKKKRHFPFVFIGDKPAEYMSLINNNPTFKISNLPTSHEEAFLWSSDNLYSKINEYFKEHELEEIKW